MADERAGAAFERGAGKGELPKEEACRDQKEVRRRLPCPREKDRCRGSRGGVGSYVYLGIVGFQPESVSRNRSRFVVHGNDTDGLDGKVLSVKIHMWHRSTTRKQDRIY